MSVTPFRHSSPASPPIVRSSSPTQLLIADGVSVHGLVQPIPPFSSEIGGKKAPSLTDQRQLVVETGRQRRNASSRSSSVRRLGSQRRSAKPRSSGVSPADAARSSCSNSGSARKSSPLPFHCSLPSPPWKLVRSPELPSSRTSPKPST